MKLYIPALGDVLTLKEDWEFTLMDEYRNTSLIELMDIKEFNGEGELVKLPKGSQLKVDRFYIRKGQGSYDSVTFFLVGEKVKGKTIERPWRLTNGDRGVYVQKIPARGVRFWVRLADANKIIFEED
jgi:hypothetical protein